jgi:hypothetical protein
MNRRGLIRNLLLGTLVTGIAPLTGAGTDVAAAGESPAALCQSMFGAGGPVGGPVAGEGPSGDPMGTTIGWDPFDWSGGLREIVTCVSVDGRAAPALTTTIATPRNDGSLEVKLTLPPGAPGSLVCEQSVLVGAGDAAGRHRTTSPVCFKLRAGESPLGSDRPAAGAATSPAPAGSPGPIVPPAPIRDAPTAATPPATYPASTPPARAAFEAGRSNGFTAGRQEGPDPLAKVAIPTPHWPDPASPAPAAAAPGRSAAAPPPAAPAGAPVAALARTGIEDHLALASAGGFLAVGGAAIIFGAPRRRRPVRRPA